jgi:hypothetical protein
LVVLEKAAKEVIGREPESPLEERGKYHNLLHIRCWDALPFGRSPLEHGAIWEKAVLN